MALVLRISKGSPLTFAEEDANFSQLANFSSGVHSGTLNVSRINGGTSANFVRGDGIYANTLIGQLTVSNPTVQIGAVGTGTAGAVRLMRDGGEVRWLSGILGSAGASSYSLFDLIRGVDVLSASITGNVTIASPSSAGIALLTTAPTAGGAAFQGQVVNNSGECFVASAAAASVSAGMAVYLNGTRKAIIGSVGGSGQLAFGASADDLVLRSVGKIRLSTDDGASSIFLDAGAATRLIPGATSFVLSNNANNADNLLVTDAGNTTVRGSLTATSNLIVSGAAATNRQVLLTTSGVTRWNLFADGAAESGGDAGSNFALARYSDAGLFLNNVFTVSRASGAINIDAPSSGPTLAINAVNTTTPYINYATGGVTTVGAAGGASALPANPTGYITIAVAGTNQKIPYYNV